MTTEMLISLGAGLIAMVAMIGGFIVRDRQVMSKISDGDEKLSEKITEGDNEVHRRVDDVVKDFVQKDDLKEYLKPLTDSISQIHEEQRAVTQRIDQVLVAIPKRATD